MKTFVVISALFISSAAFAQQTKSAVLVPQQAVAPVTATVVVTSTDSVRNNQPAATVQQNVSMTLLPQTQLSNVVATAVSDSSLTMQKNNAATQTPGVMMLDGTKSTVPVPVKAKTEAAAPGHGAQPK